MTAADERWRAREDRARPSTPIPVENPATGETIGHVPAMGADEVAELVHRARAAQPGWEALGFEGRAAVMRAMRRWVVENRERVVRVLMEEGGKTWEDAQTGELLYCADALGFWASRARRYLADERVRPHSPFLLGRTLIQRYRPYAVVGVVGPWNYPLTNNFGDAIPALMAGSAVVLKPSSVTPRTSLLMAEGMKAAGLPDDVFLVATGTAEAGAALIDHVDMLHFTGSTAVGRKVMARAAERPVPVTLELGGNDPMIVLRDADLDRAARAALFGGMHNGGQACISVERVYVEEAVHDEFVRRVVEQARRLRQGVPGGPGSVDVGAVTLAEQAETIDRQVREAVDAGATIEVGGGRADGPGCYFQPTVLTDVDHSMAIMTDETFGPTLPIMRVRDADEALRLANDSPYGLDASVWTGDRRRGERLARRVEAGAVCVNDALANYLALDVSLGGAKESGIGARHGAKGIQKYCQTQSILVRRFGLRREPQFFPNSRWRTKLVERALVLLYGRGGRRHDAQRPRRRWRLASARRGSAGRARQRTAGASSGS